MKNNNLILDKVELFEGINKNNLANLLECLNSKTVYCQKNQFIWMQGDENFSIGILLKGQLNIIKEDYAGNRNIIANINAPDIFGESLVCSETKYSPVSVQASMDSTIMTVEFLRLIKTCANSCSFHTRLIQNMLKIISIKNLNLNTKMDYFSKKNH